MATTTYWVTQAAVAVSAAAGVLEAGKKKIDLFGMLLIAFVAALGGGTIRDLLLDRTVFWIKDQNYLFVAIGSGLVTFFLARWIKLSKNAFLLPDAAGLALFTVAGTNVALNLQVPWFVASFMGVITGVMGGVLRDVLCNEEPLIFQGALYATVAWLGALGLIACLHLGMQPLPAAVLIGLLIFVVRMVAIKRNIGLPMYRSR